MTELKQRLEELVTETCQTVPEALANTLLEANYKPSDLANYTAGIVKRMHPVAALRILRDLMTIRESSMQGNTKTLGLGMQTIQSLLDWNDEHPDLGRKELVEDHPE